MAALGLELAGDEFASACGGGPADVAEVVSGAVLAEGFEFSAEATVAHLPELEVDFAALGEEEGLLFGGAERGVDADGLGEWSDGPAGDESERAAIADVELAGLNIAALAGMDGVADGGRLAGVGAEFVDCRSFEELRR